MTLMNFDFTNEIIKNLKKKGFKDIGPQTIRMVGKVHLLGDKGRYIGYLGPIKLANTIDETFDRIQKCLQEIESTHGRYPYEILLQAGGNIPMPEWFKKWCEENGIRFRHLNDEQILGGDM